MERFRRAIRGEARVRALVLAVTFIVVGGVANHLVFPPHPSAVLWLPSGIALAFLLRSPPRRWPVLLAAVFVADVVSVLVHGFPIPAWVSGLWGLSNCLRALLGAWLIRRFVGTTIRLTNRWEVAGLLFFGGLVSPLISATLGAFGYTFSSEPSSFWADWVNWWLSDGLGTILVAPLLLTWSPEAFHPERGRRFAEWLALMVLSALGAHLIFGHATSGGIRASLAYASIPFVLWGALRMGPFGAASGSAVVAILALWHTTNGRGPFGTLAAPLSEKVSSLQAFLAILGLTALTLAAVVAERWQAEERQRLLVQAGEVLAATLNVRESFPRVARLVSSRVGMGVAMVLAGEDGMFEEVARAGWSPEREAQLRGQMPPLPDSSRHWSTQEGRGALAPLWGRGTVEGVLVLMSDERVPCAGATDLALAEELANQCSLALESAHLYERAHQAIEARNEFIAIAAHELRTPLTALKLHVQSLDALLRRERASEAARVGSTLRVEAPPGLTAWWDRGLVEQALVNLLANALKFGAGHPVEVHVTSAGGWVRIAVRDHGIGIAPEALERIFERFERAVSSRQYGGLGLGLFLTRQIAESHGGTIHVESHAGDGSTFVLLLPVGEPPHSSLDAWGSAK